MLSQGCPAVGFPTRISIRNSYENLAPSYRENTLVSKQLPCQVIAFIGYRCPASSEAFPLRLPSPVYHVLTCIHRKRSHAPEETGAVTVIQSFGDCRNLAQQRSLAGQHEAAVTASRFSHGSSAACQAIFRFFKDHSNPSIRTAMASSWAHGGGAPARRYLILF